MHAQNPLLQNSSIGDPAAVCPSAATEFTETQDLTWRLLDGIIEDDQFERLESLLSENELSRREYVDVVRLHEGLMSLFMEL